MKGANQGQDLACDLPCGELLSPCTLWSAVTPNSSAQLRSGDRNSVASAREAPTSSALKNYIKSWSKNLVLEKVGVWWFCFPCVKGMGWNLGLGCKYTWYEPLQAVLHLAVNLIVHPCFFVVVSVVYVFYRVPWHLVSQQEGHLLKYGTKDEKMLAPTLSRASHPSCPGI